MKACIVAVALCGVFVAMAPTLFPNMYGLFTLPPDTLQAFFDSYDIYNYTMPEERIQHLGPNYKEITERKIADCYAVINFLCAIGGLEKQYIPPLLSDTASIPEQQVMYEESLATHLNMGDNEANLLELGCGRGKILQGMGARHPKWSITGIVNDDTQAKFGKEQVMTTNPKLNIVQQDLNAPYPFPDDNFDGGYEIGSFTFVEDVYKYAKELRRVIRKDGRFIIGCDWVNYEKYDQTNPDHLRKYNLARQIGIAGFNTKLVPEIIGDFERAGWKKVYHADDSNGRFAEQLRKVHNSFEWTRVLATFLETVDVFGLLGTAHLTFHQLAEGFNAFVSGHDEDLFHICHTFVFEAV